MNDRELRNLKLIQEIINLHSKLKDKGICRECRHLYPCKTRLILLGRGSAGQNFPETNP